jgi:hypothetical protein
MPPAPTTDLVVAGRKLANWILANQLDSVLANLAPGSNADSTRMELTGFIEELAMRGGNELKVTDEKVVRRNGRYQYWRTAEFEQAPSAVLLRIVLTPDGKYGGIGIGLANNPPPSILERQRRQRSEFRIQMSELSSTPLNSEI